MSSKSFAVSPFTMPAALLAADQFLGDHALWSGDPANPGQALAWLETWRRRARVAAAMPEIRRHATTDAAEHAAWLRAEGWDAQVQPGGPLDLYLGAALNIAADWLQSGMAHSSPGGVDGVDRVILKAGVVVTPAPRGTHRTACVTTRRGDLSFVFQQLDYAPVDAGGAAEARPQRRRALRRRPAAGARVPRLPDGRPGDEGRSAARHRDQVRR